MLFSLRLMFCAQASGSQLKLTAPSTGPTASLNDATGLEIEEGMRLTLGARSTSIEEGCSTADDCSFKQSLITFFIPLASFF